MDLVVPLGVNKKFTPDQLDKLSEVEFGNQDLLITIEKFSKVAWDRVEIPEVGMADGTALLVEHLDRWSGRAIGSAPGQYQELSLLRTKDLLLGDVVGHIGQFL